MVPNHYMIFEGSLYYDERIEKMHISEMIRNALKDSSLFAFDGAETEDDSRIDP